MAPTDLTIPFADAVEVAVDEPIVKLEVPVEGGQTETEEVRAKEEMPMI